MTQNTRSARINIRNVESLQPGESIRDTELKGFIVRRRKGAPSYALHARVNGRLVLHTIGTHGSPWTPESARREAATLKGEIAKGINPNDAKKAARLEAAKDISVSKLCALYEGAGFPSGKRSGGFKKPSTIATDKGRIKRHILPLLGDVRISALSADDVRRFYEAVAAGKTATTERTGKYGRAIVEGGTGTARKAVMLLSAILQFARREKILQGNPIREGLALGEIKLQQDRKMERFLSEDDLARLGKVLAEASGENEKAVAAIRLLLFTGARKGEILSLRWRDVDLERGIATLPTSKTGRKVILLNPPARAVLAEIPRQAHSPFVFPAEFDPSEKAKTGLEIEAKHYVGLPKVWARLRAKAKLSDCRLHDLRHTFASVGAQGGGSLYIVGKLLGHADAATTQRYAHLGDDPLKQAADRIGESLAEKLAKPPKEEATSARLKG